MTINEKKDTIQIIKKVPGASLYQAILIFKPSNTRVSGYGMSIDIAKHNAIYNLKKKIYEKPKKCNCGATILAWKIHSDECNLNTNDNK